jgi:hypothetical protein
MMRIRRTAREDELRAGKTKPLFTDASLGLRI